MIMPPRRLLIIKPSSFGDIIHTLPALASLSQHWPQTLIDWLVKDEWAGLLCNQQVLNEVLSFPENLAAWLSLRKTLQERRYDMVIDFQGLLRSGAASFLAKAPARIGFAAGREGSRWCYTVCIKSSAGAIHAVDRNLDMLKQIGVPMSGPVTFPLRLPAETESWAEALWTREQIEGGENTVVVHPAARWETKRWMAERYAQVADRLSSRMGARIILVAGGEQISQVDEVLRHLRGPAINLAGKSTLLELAALLKKSTLVISNDSGPMHLAAAVGTPVVALFGPTDPRRVGPYGAAHVVLKKQFQCAGCTRRGCAHEQQCLKLITVDDVVAAATPFLPNRSLKDKAPAGSGARY
jgi:lipopolysaccharide heptosyltransferase I